MIPLYVSTDDTFEYDEKKSVCPFKIQLIFNFS